VNEWLSLAVKLARPDPRKIRGILLAFSRWRSGRQPGRDRRCSFAAREVHPWTFTTTPSATCP